jgi:hypothetical protein
MLLSRRGHGLGRALAARCFGVVSRVVALLQGGWWVGLRRRLDRPEVNVVRPSVRSRIARRRRLGFRANLLLRSFSFRP